MKITPHPAIPGRWEMKIPGGDWVGLWERDGSWCWVSPDVAEDGPRCGFRTRDAAAKAALKFHAAKATKRAAGAGSSPGLADMALKERGVATRPEHAGYIHPNGTLIDWGGHGGIRGDDDHRNFPERLWSAVVRTMPNWREDRDSVSDVMDQFVYLSGAPRVHLTGDYFFVDRGAVTLTPEQVHALTLAWRRLGRPQNVVVDLERGSVEADAFTDTDLRRALAQTKPTASNPAAGVTRCENCGKPATWELTWANGEWAPACDACRRGVWAGADAAVRLLLENPSGGARRNPSNGWERLTRVGPAAFEHSSSAAWIRPSGAIYDASVLGGEPHSTSAKAVTGIDDSDRAMYAMMRGGALRWTSFYADAGVSFFHAPTAAQLANVRAMMRETGATSLTWERVAWKNGQLRIAEYGTGLEPLLRRLPRSNPATSQLCAWCRRWIGENGKPTGAPQPAELDATPGISHGICAPCRDAMLAGLDG